ncbi:carboxypeptidase-like regulatory domain-containing protein [Aquimarina algiphila]|uniref:Uncharacterized protein n=2 Tax=Flavobacteriaceae TaxID=49546 RepID=A0A554VEY5_9FLAO|nr:carboxypeptidase-like regulatory domain-containing protein [Aquimarina algiphila]TSE05687.1 hypothetical protein FOF46_21915 [Aquimarina algiphila]
MLLQKNSITKILIGLTLFLNYSLSFGQPSSMNKITGYVTHDNVPLNNVNIFVKGTDRKAITNKKGQYSLQASEKEVIQYSFVGMKPVEIVVEDVTDFLNVKMAKVVSDLEEVLVEGDENVKSFGTKKQKRPKVSTAYGDIDRRSFSNAVQIIEGKDLWLGSGNIAQSLQNQLALSGYGSFGIRPTGTFSGRKTALWDIDGMIFENNPPHVDLVDVDYVAVLRSVASTTLYGMRGASGVIVVRTKGASKSEVLKQQLGFRNQSKYKNDALPYRDFSFNTEYLKKLERVPNQELYDSYKDLSAQYKNSPSFYLDVSNFFRIEKRNKKMSLAVLEDMEEAFDQNPEALKALAYTYQELGEKSKAIKVYYKIAFLRSSYTQSFRDLANAYIKNKQYKEGWDMYLRYLQRGNKLQDKGIEQIVYNEMKSLYLQKKKVAKIKEVFIPKDKKNNPESDLRVVFEWNTSEAEFKFEFVDPKLNSFVYEHSMEKNSERVADQKAKGYSSEEFFIYDMNSGDWLINMTYLGNKKYDPTYLKATVYKNWGRKNQKEETKVFKLSDLNNKVQLFKFNSTIPVSSAVSSN